jgi:hypothetical protein
VEMDEEGKVSLSEESDLASEETFERCQTDRDAHVRKDMHDILNGIVISSQKGNYSWSGLRREV